MTTTLNAPSTRVARPAMCSSCESRWARIAGLMAIGLGCGACSSLGHRQLPIDRFDYNTAIASSANEQMLLNVVRLRFGEVPMFLAVNSVLTQYIWNAEGGVNGSSGESLGFPTWGVGGSVHARYIERPTVTYTPLTGHEFAAQLISPVRADLVFSLVSSGWPPDQLLVMTLQRINHVENVGFAADPDASLKQSREFSLVVELIIELAKRDAIELVRSIAPEPDESYLNFAEGADGQTQELIRELKDLTGLDQGRSRFRVTRKIVGRAPEEVTIRMHSLLELMGLLSVGIDATPEELATRHVASPLETGGVAVPLHVRCQLQRPADAFVAVEYAGNWFYVPRSDLASKRAFGLLAYLFQMQASQQQGAGPLLTVPIG